MAQGVGQNFWKKHMQRFEAFFFNILPSATFFSFQQTQLMPPNPTSKTWFCQPDHATILSVLNLTWFMSRLHQNQNPRNTSKRGQQEQQ